jgi:hypothetical protein
LTALNTGMTTLTHNDWRAAGQDLFGSDLMSWRFVCPACGDVANGHDFAAALSENPRTRLDGSVVQALDLLGSWCVGRAIGGTEPTRGCDRTAYGLFRGPVRVTLPDGRPPMFSFRFADTAQAAR